MQARPWLICYDVSENRARRSVDKALQGLGQRIQHSVFLCRLTPAQAHQTLAELALLLDPGTDSLRFYPLDADTPCPPQPTPNAHASWHIF